MIPYVGFTPFICILITSIFSSCVSDERKESSPKEIYILTPVKQDTWWKIYFNGSTHHRSIQKSEKSNDMALNIERYLNESIVSIGVIGRNGSAIGDSNESDYNWKVISDISNEVLKGEVWTEQTAGAAEEEKQPEVRRDRISQGECLKDFESVCMNIAQVLLHLTTLSFA
jgi:hypothetical protein